MFEQGDYIIYGTSGVCVVDKIGSLDSLPTKDKRLYYTLRPCYSKGSTIFTPVDNEKVLMRKVISKEEALQLIDEMEETECLWISDEKKRELQYKETFRKCDCRELVKIIKTIYLRKQDRLREGKKTTADDERYFHMAEDSLYGELAVALKMEKNEVKDFVLSRIQTEEV